MYVCYSIVKIIVVVNDLYFTYCVYRLYVLHTQYTYAIYHLYIIIIIIFPYQIQVEESMKNCNFVYKIKIRRVLLCISLKHGALVAG
jgi:hypothetical protein